MNIPWPRRRAAPDTQAGRLVQLGSEPAPYPRLMHSAPSPQMLLDIEREAYVQGVRDGRLAAFIWGALIGGMLVAVAFSAGVR